MHLGRRSKDGDWTARLGGYFRWHAVVWKLGGTTERSFLLLAAVTIYLFLPVALVWFVLSGWRLQFPWEFYVTVGLAFSNTLAFLDVFGMATYTKASWGELLRQGHFHPHDKAAGEYLSYLESHGTNGRLPRATGLAVLYWAVFYGLIVVSVLLGLWLLPLIGPLTPAAFLAFDAPIVFACRRIARLRLPIIYGKRDSSGIQLSEPIFPSFHWE